MKAEMVSMSGSDSTILAHYQSRVSDGAWHHLQLSVVGNRAGLVLDGVTQSAVLLTPIRTGDTQITITQSRAPFLFALLPGAAVGAQHWKDKELVMYV